MSGQSSSGRSQTPVETDQETLLPGDHAQSFLLALKGGLINSLCRENGIYGRKMAISQRMREAADLQ